MSQQPAVEERTWRDYLRPLGNHALVIALLVLIFAAGSMLSTMLVSGSTPFEAESVILFKSGGSGRIDLTSETALRDPTLEATRLQRNVQLLADSIDVAAKVKERAATSKESDVSSLAARDAVDLLDAIDVQARGDQIVIRAKAATAPAATWLANTWAEEAVVKVNKVFAVPSTNVTGALDEAKQELEADQRALEQFLASNPIGTLTQELTQTLHFIEAASLSHSDSQSTLYIAEREAIRDQVAAYYTYTYGLDQQLSELEALQARIEQSPEDPEALYANQVTLLIALNKAISGNPGSQVQLQFNVADIGKAPLTRSGQLRAVSSSIVALQDLQDAIRARIKTLEGKLSEPLPAVTPGVGVVPSALKDLLARRNELESQIEQKTFELSQLEGNRDLQQSTYDLLRKRLAEQSVNEVISGVVDIGSRADVSQTERSTGSLRRLALTLAQWVFVALVLGIAAAYLVSLLRPNFNSNDALRRRFRRAVGRAARVSST
jgi:hypothetical protein